MTSPESLRVSFDILVENLTYKKLERQASIKAIVFFINYQRRRCIKKLREHANSSSSQRFKDLLSTTFSDLRMQKIGLHRWKQFKQFTLRNSHFTKLTNIFPSENSLLLRQYFTRLFQLLQYKIRKQNAKHMFLRKNKVIAYHAFKLIQKNRWIKQKWKKRCENITYDAKQMRISKAFGK